MTYLELESHCVLRERRPFKRFNVDLVKTAGNCPDLVSHFHRVDKSVSPVDTL